MQQLLTHLEERALWEQRYRQLLVDEDDSYVELFALSRRRGWPPWQDWHRRLASELEDGKAFHCLDDRDFYAYGTTKYDDDAFDDWYINLWDDNDGKDDTDSHDSIGDRDNWEEEDD
jgi:hypothetical protein